MYKYILASVEHVHVELHVQKVTKQTVGNSYKTKTVTTSKRWPPLKIYAQETSTRFRFHVMLLNAKYMKLEYGLQIIFKQLTSTLRAC